MSKIIIGNITLSLAILFICGCTMSYRNHINIKGNIEDERYISANNVFSCKVPYLVKPGARIEDSYSPDGAACNVYFQDDMGTWINIVCIPSPQQGKQTAFIERFIGSEKTERLHREQIKYGDREMVYAIVKVPKGSNMVEASKGRHDLIEGVLIFEKNKHFYRLSSQDRNIFLGSKAIDPKERVRYLKSDLLKFYDSMKFPN